MILWRSFAFALVVLLCGASNAASLCTTEEAVVFNCKVKRSNRIASVCASPNLKRDVGYLQYRFGAPGKAPELVFPKSRSRSQAQFYWRRLHPYHSSLIEIGFRSGPYFYTLSATDGAEDLNGISGGVQAGNVAVGKAFYSSNVALLECDAYPEGSLDLEGIAQDGDLLPPPLI
ncbi:hypothetical protein [Niveibacterium microcysteis]|uniref:Uncharacterized protein n=1 Tax=Niveibacterium microcysteis TaxID=2811415 RepID=A0ABX7M4I9_9RHOO|nr:hypothetical protein [Niveibacterium microcysteis]QSI76658.1 hypothetical protein JY500_19705 [Niveibacterium microcysteis]